MSFKKQPGVPYISYREMVVALLYYGQSTTAPDLGVHVPTWPLTSQTEVRCPTLDLCSLMCEMRQLEFPSNSPTLSLEQDLYIQVFFKYKSNVTRLRVERDFEGHSDPAHPDA